MLEVVINFLLLAHYLTWLEASFLPFDKPFELKKNCNKYNIPLIFSNSIIKLHGEVNWDHWHDKTLSCIYTTGWDMRDKVALLSRSDRKIDDRGKLKRDMKHLFKWKSDIKSHFLVWKVCVSGVVVKKDLLCDPPARGFLFYQFFINSKWTKIILQAMVEICSKAVRSEWR